MIIREFRRWYQMNEQATRIEQAADLARWSLRLCRRLGITKAMFMESVNDIVTGLWYKRWVEDTAKAKREKVGK